MDYDLILRGGRVIDPSQRLDGIVDVAFSAGRVGRIGSQLEGGANTDIRDVSGLIVTPGLIDLHTHVYWGGTSLGIDAEQFCRTSGVTTAIDTVTWVQTPMRTSRHTSIPTTRQPLSKGPHATAMLPSCHPDLRRREMLFLPLIKPSAP